MAYTLVASNTDLNTTATLEVVVQSHGSSAGPVNGPLGENASLWMLDSRLRFNQAEDAATGQYCLQRFTNKNGDWVRKVHESAGAITSYGLWVRITDFWEAS